MRPEGDGFVVIDLLGRSMTDAVDWLSAEETLEATGLGYLAEPFELLLDADADAAVDADADADDAADADAGTDTGVAPTGLDVAATRDDGGGRWLRVRIVEVSTERVRVKKEDWGDVTVPGVYYEAPFPVADRLRPLRGDSHLIPRA